MSVLGTAGVASAGTGQVASRWHHEHRRGEAHENDRCVAEHNVLVGPVCVTLVDVPILNHLLG